MVSHESAVLAGLAVLALAVYAVGAATVGPSLGLVGAGEPADSPVDVSREFHRAFEPMDPGIWNDSVGYHETDVGFREVSDAVGLEYESIKTYNSTQETVSNSGVYVADVDNDGWPDVLATGAEEPVLFGNDGGEFRATDRLPDLEGTVQSALFVDYDADGWRDLILFVVEGEPVVLENVGGSFERRPNLLTVDFRFPQGATAADFDGDGCPGLAVIQYGHWGIQHPLGQRNYSVALERDNGFANHLLTGDCEGFRKATAEAGFEGTAWSLATSAVDFTGDGRPDVHVTNDFNHDVVYLNRGDGTFERRVLGDRTNRNGMSSEVADVTGDGLPDVFVTNIYYPPYVREEIEVSLDIRAAGNNLLVSQGDGSFAERAAEWNVRKGGWGWAATLSDFDNDGDRDLLQATRMHSNDDLTEFFLTDEHTQIDRMYRFPVVRERVGDGFRRVNASAAGFAVSNGRGVAELDYDRDGDLDVLLSDVNGPLYLYENTHEGNGAVSVELRGGDGRSALGATVDVTAGGTTRTRVRNAKADFLSQDTTVLHAGVGSARQASVTVTWADGSTARVGDVPTNRRLVVHRNGTVRTSPLEG